MKVVIYSRYPDNPEQPKGGVESVTVVLVKALARLENLDIHLVTLEKNRMEISVEQHENFIVHRLPGSGWPQVPDILIGPGKYRLKKYVLDMKPDVFHSTEVFGLTFGRTPFPHIFTLHGFDHEEVLLKKTILSKPRSVIWLSLIHI